MHSQSFRQEEKLYREQVDLMGHAHLGGKTVLYLLDGLFSGKHPADPAPKVVVGALQWRLDFELAGIARPRGD